MAHENALLMHAVLAVSGTHLAYKLPDATGVEITAGRHYLRAIRGVQDTIASGQMDEKYCIQRLLLAVSFLCQYEVLTNAPEDTLSFHLRAVGQLFRHLLDKGYTPSPHLDASDETLGFAYEGYLFLTCCNSITLTDEEDGSLYDETMGRLRELRQTVCFGSIVAGAHDLFELIPRVKRLYIRRLAEELTGAGFPSPDVLAMYEDLNNLVES